MTKQNIEIFKTQDGQAEVTVQFEGDTVWLTQAQMVELFERNKRTVSEHIRNIFKEGELQEDAVVRNFRTTAEDGKSYAVNHYNLDVIISVGYRIKSQRGTQFRIWATQKLRDYLVKGYSFDEKRFEENATELTAALELVRKAAQSPELNSQSGQGLVEIISRYTESFLWLQQYDEGTLSEIKGEPGGLLFSDEEANDILAFLKKNLMERNEATDLFARPKEHGIESILGNLRQSAFGEDAYPTIESKAAHLLYFTVKDHPFSDGNKRSAAGLFVNFLFKNKRLFNNKNEPIINSAGLAALTLLVAESDPKQKDTMIKLIMNMLSQDKQP